MNLILISSSPRRKKILSEAGLKFDIETVEISEIIDKNLNPKEALSQVATDKMKAFLSGGKSLKYKNYLAITADTSVVIEGRYLEKPKNAEQAAEFLRLLSGRTHSVFTGVCLYESWTEVWVKHCEETKVSFRDLTDAEIQNYIQQAKPMDKAGAYGLQDEEHDFITQVKGSVNNVIGFPLEWFLHQININYFQK